MESSGTDDMLGNERMWIKDICVFSEKRLKMPVYNLDLSARLRSGNKPPFYQMEDFYRFQMAPDINHHL